MNAARRSRLPVGACPACTEETLVSNGAFWSCEVCTYAVTSTALAVDRAAAQAVAKSSRPHFHEHFDTRLEAEAHRATAEPAGSRR